MVCLKKFGVFAVALFFCLLQTTVEAEVDANGRFSITMPCLPLIVGLDNTHLPLISVRVNDSVTATFMVDTGTNMLAVTDDFAKRLKMPLDKSIQAGYPNTIYGKAIRTTTLAKIEIGKIMIKNQVMVVLPPKSLAGLERSVDGIIGTNFLSHVAVLWNFSQQKLTFFIPGDLKSPDLQALGFREDAMIALTKAPNGLWAMQATFANSSKNAQDTLILDTGAVTTSLSQLLSVSLNLKPVRTNVSKWGFKGSEETNTAPVDKITIGSVSLTNFPIDYNSHVSDLTPPALGMDVMSRFSVLMDFPAKKMYMQSNFSLVPPITVTPQATPQGKTLLPSPP